MPSKNLPIVKSAAVTTAPSHTSFHLTTASGTYLKMSAKRPVTMANEKAKLTTCQRGSPPGSAFENVEPTALNSALKTSDTSSMNATPSTIVKDRKRALICPTTPRPGLGFTSQMVSRVDWSSPNTPDAPRKSVTTPTTVLTMPLDGDFAWAMIAWIPS